MYTLGLPPQHTLSKMERWGSPTFTMLRLSSSRHRISATRTKLKLGKARLLDSSRVIVRHDSVILFQRRYDMNARTAEFSADTSATTMWQSNDNDSPVSLVVGLSPAVSLSKIFVTFSSSLPAKITLQYYSEQVSDWRDLQHFAENCEQSFQMGNDEQ